MIARALVSAKTRRRLSNAAPARRFQTLGAILVFPLCFAGSAKAQVGASASLDSDYRFRGLTLSDGRPTVSVNLSYDHGSGVYIGGSAIAVETRHTGVEVLGYTDYLGYARRLGSGPTADVGVTNAKVTEYRAGRYTADYTEFYAGLIFNNISSHIYYSPSYFGSKMSTVYVDLNGAVTPARDWRLFGHAGVLTPLSGQTGDGARRERYDLRVGVARAFGSCELHLAWTISAPAVLYPAERVKTRDAIVLGAAYFF